MSFFDGIRKLTQPFDEQDEDFFDGDELPVDNEPTVVMPRRERAAEAPAERKRDFFRAEPRDPFREAVRETYRETDSYIKEFEQFEAAPAAPVKNDSRVVNIHTTTAVQVVLSKPERFDQAAEIADHLREKRTVVMNLETTQKDVARRLVDFLSGVAYANDGKIKKVAINTYIITPYNVDIMGDLIDELENSGVSFY